MGILAPQGMKAGGHDGHAAVPFIFNGAGGHDARHAAAGADQHGDEALAGKAELAEDTVHDEGDAGHVAHVLQNGQHQEQHQHLRHEAQHRAHAADDAVARPGPAARRHAPMLSSRPPRLPCRPLAPNTSLVQSVKKVPNGPMAIQYTKQHHHREDGQRQHAVGDNPVDLVRGGQACLAAFFFTQLSTSCADVGIALVGDDAFGVVVHLASHSPGYALPGASLQRSVQLQLRQHLFVPLKELDGIPAQVLGAIHLAW